MLRGMLLNLCELNVLSLNVYLQSMCILIYLLLNKTVESCERRSALDLRLTTLLPCLQKNLSGESIFIELITRKREFQSLSSRIGKI